GIFNSGTTVGAILAPLTVPWMAAKWGWESTFLIIGAAGFLWLIFWFIYYEKPEKQRRLSPEELVYIHSDEQVAGAQATGQDTEKVRWIRLLGFRQTWAFAVGKFMTDGVWWFFLFWLPSYLHAQYGMSGTELMLPLAVLYGMTTLG